MTSYETGHQAEARAARFLVRQGFAVRELNWKTRFCEIDIVAEKGSCIYFVEVKYRSSTQWGAGLEYITAKKLKQMRFAASYWLARHDWHQQSCLAALSIDGNIFRLEMLTD